MKGGSIFGSLPRRYARALIQIAQEENAVADYGTALVTIVSALQSEDRGLSFLKTLSDESIDFNDRLRAIEEVADRMQVPALFKNFLSLLIKKERMEILPEISREYLALQDEILGIVRVAIVAPAQPSSELLSRTQSVLSQRLQKKIVTHGEADPALIGGIVLRVNHTVYDGSIKKELERIKNAMINA
jgi:F-type H+-transporting ATPase subunit delta